MTIVYMNPTYSNTPKQRLCDFANYKLDQLIIGPVRSQLQEVYLTGAFTEGTPGAIARFEHLRMGEGVPPGHTLPRTNDQVETLDLKIVRQPMSFIGGILFGYFGEDLVWSVYLNGQPAYNKEALVNALNVRALELVAPLNLEAEDIVRITDVYDGPVLQYHVAEIRPDHPLIYGQFRFLPQTGEVNQQ